MKSEHYPDDPDRSVAAPCAACVTTADLAEIIAEVAGIKKSEERRELRFNNGLLTFSVVANVALLIALGIAHLNA